MSRLSVAELKTLEIIANPAEKEYLPRVHLEKLSRLELIEPVGCHVTLSLKGKEILFKGK